MGKEEPRPIVQLTGEDGNIFFIVGRCQKAMRRAGCSEEHVKALGKEVQEQKSYDKALQVVMKYVEAR